MTMPFQSEFAAVSTKINRVVVDIYIQAVLKDDYNSKRHIEALERAVLNFTTDYIRDTLPKLKW